MRSIALKSDVRRVIRICAFSPRFARNDPDFRMMVVLGFRHASRRADRDDRGASGAIHRLRRSVANANPKVGLRLVSMGETAEHCR